MGRKRSANSENRIYFSDKEEQAVKDYLCETDERVKSIIYQTTFPPQYVR